MLVKFLKVVSFAGVISNKFMSIWICTDLVSSLVTGGNHGWEEMAIQNLASRKSCQLLLIRGGSSWHAPIKKSSKQITAVVGRSVATITIMYIKRFYTDCMTGILPSTLTKSCMFGQIEFVFAVGWWNKTCAEGRKDGWVVCLPIWELSKVEMPQKYPKVPWGSLRVRFIWYILMLATTISG